MTIRTWLYSDLPALIGNLIVAIPVVLIFVVFIGIPTLRHSTGDSRDVDGIVISSGLNGRGLDVVIVKLNDEKQVRTIAPAWPPFLLVHASNSRSIHKTLVNRNTLSSGQIDR